MAEISDIRKIVQTMSDEELLAVVRGQRTVKLDEPSGKKKKAAPKKTTSETRKTRIDKSLAQLAALPPAEAAALLKQLQGGS